MTITTSLAWKLAGRMLVRHPGLSIIGGLTLAVAIGLAAGWFVITQQFVSPPGASMSVVLLLSNMLAWLILAAACACVGRLLFARTATREPEIIVRDALGPSRARVMMQLFLEVFVLCAAARWSASLPRVSHSISEQPLR